MIQHVRYASSELYVPLGDVHQMLRRNTASGSEFKEKPHNHARTCSPSYTPGTFKNLLHTFVFVCQWTNMLKPTATFGTQASCNMKLMINRLKASNADAVLIANIKTHSVS